MKSVTNLGLAVLALLAFLHASLPADRNFHSCFRFQLLERIAARTCKEK
jgi:hypothetical protein